MPTMEQVFSQFDFAQFANLATRFILAAFLGTLLSFQRSPDRDRLHLIEAHALLAIAGAMFLTIIAGDFIRAVGLLGAASVVRYRYAIQNPRDASTLILSLGIGMACGSDLLHVAFMGTVLIVFISQMIALFPDALPFTHVASREEKILRLQATDFDQMMARVDEIMKEYKIDYSLISIERKFPRADEGVSTEVNLQVDMPSDISLHDLTNHIVDENIFRISWHKPRPW